MSTVTKSSPREQALFERTGMPPIGKAIPLALQHVVAMVVGCITMPMIVASAGGVSASDQIIMVQGSLLVAAFAILLQAFGVKGFISSGLPIMVGSGFAFLPTLRSVVELHGINGMIGAQIAGACMGMLVGLVFKKIRFLFPPIVTASVVLTIGISLYDTAVNYMAGGTANTYELVVETKGLSEALVYGSWQNWLVAAITLAAVMVLNNKGKGIFKLASILIGMAFGYIVAAFFGMVDFSDVSTASMFAVPEFMPFGIEFDFASCVAIGLLFAINSIQAIGDFTATTVGGMDRDPSNQELKGGIVAYGLTNALSAFFGGLPTATYSQNVGIVTTNKVVNRTVFGLTGLFLLLAGVSPKFAAILTTIPQCVLGGATITVFSTIAMTGMKLIASQKLDARNTTIVGLSAALGVGISQASSSLVQFPEEFIIIFGKSPVVIATVMAILLNLILPREEKK